MSVVRVQDSSDPEVRIPPTTVTMIGIHMDPEMMVIAMVRD